jgi:O-antigen/teichoic acid export membrane protein
VGSATNGLLAYVVFALTTRTLGAEGAAPVSVLWTWWGFAAAAFTFPVQHWVTRTVLAHGSATVRAALPRLGLVVLGLALVTGLVAWLLRDPLFHRGDAWFPLLVLLTTLGSTMVGLVRGGLGARQRFGALATSLVVENAARCVLVGGLALAGADDPVAYGVALVVGQYTALAWPSALRFDRSGTVAASRPLAFLAGAGAAQLTAQVALSSGPVVLALSGGSPQQITSLFAALALFRAPYLLVQGSVAALTVRLTQLVVEGRTVALTRIRRILLGGAVAVLAPAFAVGWFAGPWALQLIFGEAVHLPAHLCGLVALGCTLAVLNLVTMIDLLAHDQPARVTAAWAVAIVLAAATFLALVQAAPLDRTVAAFVAAEAAATAGLLLLLPRERAVRPA